MTKVVVYSLLLLLGLGLSQLVPSWLGASYGAVAHVVKFLTMVALAFIMIHVGYEFDIDRSNLRAYGWDYVVAATAAAFPWIFCAVYFILLLSPAGTWSSWDGWRDALLAGRFAAPTSAGVLFSMLAAAGLATTWVFRKTRILAIFDDLDTVLLMVPLKMLIVGLAWQLGLIVIVMVAQLWLAWRYLHRWRLPVRWPWVLSYAAGIAIVCELIYYASLGLDELVPIHIEVLLPAFVLGCVIARPAGHETEAAAHDQFECPAERRAGTIISAVFMVLVGLSMPAMTGMSAPEQAAPADTRVLDADLPGAGASASAEPEPLTLSWGALAGHVILVTLVANLGKMFPVFCYRREAPWRHRLAVAVAMFPRGEVGAGVLIISLSYGIGGPMITVAMFSLALNLLLTGVFILIVRQLMGRDPAAANG